MKLKAYKKHLIIFLVLSIFTHKSFALNPVLDIINLVKDKVITPIKQDRQAKKNAHFEAARISQALIKGKSVIFFPTPSAEQVWVDDLGDEGFSIGGKETSPKAGDFSQISFIVVEPGTYYLERIAPQEQHKTQHVNYANNKKIKENSIGWVQITNTQFDERYTRPVWKNEQRGHEQRVVSQTCQTVNGVEIYGSCVSNYGWVEVVTQAAGYYPEPYYVKEDGIILDTIFNENQSPASITVNAGEVVFTDELIFLSEKSIGWDTDSCAKSSQNQWICLMKLIRFTPYDSENRNKDFKKYLVKNGWTQDLADSIIYRPLKLNAVSERTNNKDGLPYYVHQE
jgi:hypothetical protein